MHSKLITIAVVLLCAYCCVPDQIDTVRRLDNIQARLGTSSGVDSCLVELRGLASRCAASPRLRARYSLLFAMALDKNYIDTTDIGVILPALEYYRKRGSATDKMQANFYLGRIYSNRGEAEKAIFCYQAALEDSASVSDVHCKELVNSAMSDVFSRNHNYGRELEYTEAALRYGKQCRDSVGVWAITGHLATSLSNLDLWVESDAAYQRFFAMPVVDSTVYMQRRINFAKSLLCRPAPDPGKSAEIIEEVAKYNGGSLSVEAICMYAYAQELLGNSTDADALLAMLPQSGEQPELVEVWSYRIRQHQGRYEEAIANLENSIMYQDTVVTMMLRQSLIAAQSDYFRLEADSAKKDIAIRRQRNALIAVLVLFGIAILCADFIRKKNSLDRKISDLSALHQSVRQMLEIQNNEKEQALLLLRRQFAAMFKSKYAMLNDLCSAYWSPIKKDRKEQIYDEVRRILGDISGDVESQLRFAENLNQTLDGILGKLRSDLPSHSDRDFIFLAFVIAGFDAKTIAILMDYSVGSVYTKKNRLKSEIDKLSSPNKHLYQEFI